PGDAQTPSPAGAGASGAAQPPASPAAETGASLPPAAVPDYVVGPQDVLTIAIFGHADLNGQFRVDADGTFTFPLVGRVKAGELTVRQLEGEMARLLREYIKAPQVSVAIAQYKSRRLFIVGE